MSTSYTSQCEVPDVVLVLCLPEVLHSVFYFMLVLCLPQVLHSVKYLMLCSFYVYLGTSQCEVPDVVLVLCLARYLVCRVCLNLCLFYVWTLQDAK